MARFGLKTWHFESTIQYGYQMGSESQFI